MPIADFVATAMAGLTAGSDEILVGGAARMKAAPDVDLFQLCAGFDWIAQLQPAHGGQQMKGFGRFEGFHATDSKKERGRPRPL